MPEQFTVTREEIVDAAMSLRGTRFRHQGRDAATGVDCVGFLAVVGGLIKYPKIFDLEGYRRTPSAQVIREMLRANCDEIPLNEVGIGDIFLMRMGGVKPRHAAIKLSDTIDIERGLEPQLIHAKGLGFDGAVVIEPIRQWISECVVGFRIRGLIID